MLADLLFIEDPRAKYKKNFYINDRNYNTKYTLRLRKFRKTFYNNNIKSNKKNKSVILYLKYYIQLQNHFIIQRKKQTNSSKHKN